MKKPYSRKILSFAFMGFLLFIHHTKLSAQTELPDSIVRERIQFIQKLLDDGKPGANRWWYGWLAGYGAATVAQGSVCLLSNDKSTRQDMALGAATTLLGVAGQILTPMTPAKAPDLLSHIPENTPEERLSKLQQAEGLLRASALREQEGRSWQTHVACGAVNIGSGLITWLAFKRTVWDGIGNFALNTAITEAQIWSQPTRAINDYRDYTSNNNSGKLQTAETKVSWYVTVYPGRVGLRIVF